MAKQRFFSEIAVRWDKIRISQGSVHSRFNPQKQQHPPGLSSGGRCCYATLQRTGSFSRAPSYRLILLSKKPSCSKTDRQVTLRSLTTFFFDRFAIWEHWGISSPKPLAWDRSLPPPVADEGRRSVGNRKECRLRHDYASFPGPQTPSSLRAYSSFLSENSLRPLPLPLSHATRPREWT